MVWRNWAHCWMMRGHTERDWMIRGCLGHYSLSQTPSWIQSQKWSVLHHIEPPRWAPLTHKIIRNNLLFYATKFGKCSLYHSVTDTLPFKPFTSIEGETSTCNLKTTTTKKPKYIYYDNEIGFASPRYPCKIPLYKKTFTSSDFLKCLPWSMSLNRLQVQVVLLIKWSC